MHKEKVTVYRKGTLQDFSYKGGRRGVQKKVTLFCRKVRWQKEEMADCGRRVLEKEKAGGVWERTGGGMGNKMHRG